MNTPLIVFGFTAMLAAHAAEHGDHAAVVEAAPAAIDAGAVADAVPPAAMPQKDPRAAARDVEQALGKAEGVRAGDVQVSTHAETVVLTGEVGSDAAASRAQAVAEEAAGGLRVSSQIKVRPGEEQVMEARTARLVKNVEEALRRDPRTAELGVAVSIDDGQVIGLHGLVPDRTGRAAAEDVAGKVAGVTQVRSHLVIPGE